MEGHQCAHAPLPPPRTSRLQVRASLKSTSTLVCDRRHVEFFEIIYILGLFIVHKGRVQWLVRVFRSIRNVRTWQERSSHTCRGGFISLSFDLGKRTKFPVELSILKEKTVRKHLPQEDDPLSQVHNFEDWSTSPKSAKMKKLGFRKICRVFPGKIILKTMWTLISSAYRDKQISPLLLWGSQCWSIHHLILDKVIKVVKT